MEATAAREVAVVDTVTAIPTGTMIAEGVDTALETLIPMGKPKGLGALAASPPSLSFHIYLST